MAISELVILSDREPSFDEWCAAADSVTKGQVVELLGGAWHVLDQDDRPVVTWWASQQIEEPRAAQQAVGQPVGPGQFWTDILLPPDADRGITIAWRLATAIGGTLERRV